MPPHPLSPVAIFVASIGLCSICLHEANRVKFTLKPASSLYVMRFAALQQSPAIFSCWPRRTHTVQKQAGIQYVAMCAMLKTPILTLNCYMNFVRGIGGRNAIVRPSGYLS